MSSEADPSALLRDSIKHYLSFGERVCAFLQMGDDVLQGSVNACHRLQRPRKAGEKAICVEASFTWR